VAVALRVAEALPADARAVVVTLLPDAGSRYLSDRFWDAA
jgi:cysteine synthase